MARSVAAYFIGVILFVLASGSNAASTTISSKVILLQFWEGHSGLLVRLEDRNLSDGFCERNDFYIVPNSHQYADQMFAMLLAARMADKTVVLRVEAGNCVERFPRVLHMDL